MDPDFSFVKKREQLATKDLKEVIARLMKRTHWRRLINGLARGKEGTEREIESRDREREREREKRAREKQIHRPRINLPKHRQRDRETE